MNNGMMEWIEGEEIFVYICSPKFWYDYDSLDNAVSYNAPALFCGV